MSQNPTDMEIHMTVCPRDSEVETNLRCAQCGDPICPRCMVYAPVGSKCPDCASIGGPVMFKVTQADLLKTGVLGGLAAIGIGFASAATLLALWSLDILAGVNISIWQILVGVAEFLGVIGVTWAIELIGGRKYAMSLRILAAVLGLLFYLAQIFSIETLDSIFPGVNVDVRILVIHLPALIGFGFGTYYAMQRFKP